METLYLDHDIHIPFANIIYFEHFTKYNNYLQRVTFIHTTTTTYITHKKIKELYDALDTSVFIMPHQSYIVNMQYIKVFSQLYLVLDNDIRIPISIKRSMQLRIEFLTYIKERSV
jgi:DNA-binding LytR/AlgR family response regulator